MPGRRRPNPGLVKIHRSYTVEEAARTLRTHKNTVRAWIRQGLQTIDSERPARIHGLELKRFLEGRRKKAKQPCPPGYIYCVKCRASAPVNGVGRHYKPISAISPSSPQLLQRLSGWH